MPSERIEPVIIRDSAAIPSGKDIQNIIIQMQPPPKRGVHWAVIVLFLALALAVVGVVWAAVVYTELHEYRKTVTAMDTNLKNIDRPIPVHYPAGTSSAFPPSQTLRLLGTINDGQVRYIAQSKHSQVYVTIPTTDCKIISGSPVCHFQGKSVTRFTG
jgi:hypothetical protein